MVWDDNGISERMITHRLDEIIRLYKIDLIALKEAYNSKDIECIREIVDNIPTLKMLKLCSEVMDCINNLEGDEL